MLINVCTCISAECVHICAWFPRCFEAVIVLETDLIRINEDPRFGWGRQARDRSPRRSGRKSGTDNGHLRRRSDSPPQHMD